MAHPRIAWPTRRGLALPLLALAAIAVGPDAAAAAQFNYAHPNGSASAATCTETAPCSLQHAVQDVAIDGEEVVLLPGNYSVTNQILVSDDITIGGLSGEKRPVVSATATQMTFNVNATVKFQNIEIRGPASGGSPVLASPGSEVTIDRASLHEPGSTSGLTVNGATVHVINSTVFSASGFAIGASGTSDLEIFNSTLVAPSANALSLTVLCVPSCPATPLKASVSNSILDGTTDIDSFAQSGAPPPEVDVDHSNYDTVNTFNTTFTEGDGNLKTSAAQFVNRAAGDLHQAPGSPTIDAGVSVPLLTMDFEFDPRPLAGSAPDMGADEFYPDSSTRYVAPRAFAVGKCSTPASACRINFAVEEVAQAGDEVVVMPGGLPHEPRDMVEATVPLNIHGAEGGPRPLVTGSWGGPVISLEGGAGSVLSDLLVQSDGFNGTAVGSDGGALVDRVFGSSTGDDTYALTLGDGDVVRNSVAWATGVGSNAVLAQVGGPASVQLRNVTAMSSAGGTFGAVLESSDDLGRLVLRNTIVRSGAGGADLRAVSLNPPDKATLDVGHSNYRSADVAQSNGPGVEELIDAGGNQTTVDPLFQDAAAGDFRQLASSPTVDAGLADAANGPLDLDRNFRALGAGPDIGAFELLPPPVVATGAASAVGASEATLAGTVDPEGQATTVRFEYGKTASYGSETAPQTVAAGADPVGFSQTLSGLEPNTTYHYRALATNSAGTSTGANMTFTTGMVPPDPGDGQPGTDVAPVVQSFDVTNRRFRRGRPGTLRRAASPRGTYFRYSLSESGRVAITLRRRAAGRRVGGRCRTPSRRNRGRRRCVRYVRAAVLRANAQSGPNALPFTGRVGRGALRIAGYRATIVAIDAAGNRSRPRSLSFAIVRR